MHYESWCALSDAELARRDIAEVNLAAAFDLPHAGQLEVRKLCAQVDQWAELVRYGTKRALRSRAARGTDREYSDSQFRMLVLVTVLQRNLGVRYNFEFSTGDYDASDSRNLFIHGLLAGHGGTCVTMPVLYAAVGRRLGYPLKLVFAQEHVFCRWDNPAGERFNIEATSQGFVSHSDEYYHRKPRPLSEKDLATGRFLRSLTPREELAFFLSQRGHCCLDNLHTARALKAFYCAHQLAPDDPAHRNEWALATIMQRAGDAMEKQIAAGDVGNMLRMPVPREAWEKAVYPEALKCLNRILSNHRARRDATARRQVFGEANAAN